VARRGWIIVATLLAVACASPEERLATHLERGEAYLEEGRAEEALLEFQSALNLRPDDPELYERVGRALYARGRFEEALQHFAHAHRLDPSRVEAAMMEARLLVLRNPARARQLVENALQEDPDRDVVQRTKAHVALNEGDLRNASAAALRAVALGPDDAENWLQLGAVYQARIQDRVRRRRPPRDELFEGGMEAFARVAELEPGDPRATVLQARLQAAWPGHDADAEASFERALAMAREGGRVADVTLVALAYDDYAERRGRSELRRRALRELLAVDADNFGAWETLAGLVGAEDPLQAEGVYLELLEKRPQEPRAHLLYASYLLGTGRAADAEAHVRQVLDEGLDDPALWEWLVRLGLRTGRPAQARAAYVELAERHPGSFAARVSEARLALAEGRAAEASSLLSPLVAEVESAELQRLKALADYRLGNLPAADRAVARAIELSPEPAPALLRLRARIAHDSGSWAEVIDGLGKLRQAGNDLSGEDRVLLATALHGVGKEEDARRMLLALLEGTHPLPAAALAYAQITRASDPAAARAALLAAFERVPGDPDLIEALTRLDVEEGQASEALERLNTVVGEGRATPATLELRAELLAGMGGYEEAEADLLRAFEANPALPGAIDLLYQVYAAQGRLEEARRSFEQADEAGVLHPGARLLLARLYLGDGQYERARDTLEKVVADRPDLWSARNDLAWVLAELGQDLDRALVLAREAQLDSGNLPATSDTIGWVHLKAGRTQAGLEEFQRAIRLAEERSEPVPPGFRYHLGLALEAMGHEEEAARAYEEALSQGEFAEAEDARRRLEAARNPESHPARPS
jgi:tetratricopeptide (TPR) repeat protein